MLSDKWHEGVGQDSPLGVVVMVEAVGWLRLAQRYGRCLIVMYRSNIAHYAFSAFKC